MRVWMTETSFMCRKHLMGEHVEIHMLIGTMKKRKSINGFIKNNLLEIDSIFDRHEQLSKEMLKRGYNHKSEIDKIRLNEIKKQYKEYQDIKVDRAKSLEELLSRCPECRENFNKMKG